MNSTTFTAPMVQEFMENSLVWVQQHGLSQQRIQEVVHAWEDVCNLPQKIKDKFGLDPDWEKAPDTGYCRKNQKDGGRDNKEFYHYNWGIEDRFLQEIKVIPPIEIERLNRQCSKLYLECYEILKGLTQGLDKHFPGIHEAFYPPTSEPDLGVLRLLRYYGTKDHVIAAPHGDRSGLTIQVAESKEGLWGSQVQWPEGKRSEYDKLSKEEKHAWLDQFMKEIVKKSPQDIPVFASRKIEVFTDGGIPTLWHKVVDEECTQDDYARWAIIFFLHPQGVEIDNTKNH